VNASAFHTRRSLIPCLTVGWDANGVMLFPDTLVAKRCFRCSGRNGCLKQCQARLVQCITNADPLNWVIWRTIPSDFPLHPSVLHGCVLASESLVHSDPSVFRPTDPLIEPLTRTTRKDIIKEQAKGLICTRSLLSLCTYHHLQ
jgi:hypothetical protein